MAKTGLFFGSFNPIHNGHLIIAEYFVEFAGFNQVWFVVSPQNPLKKKKSLLAGHQRLAMARIAVEDDNRFKVCDIEFKLPIPSYTIDTLTYLQEQFPEKEFCLIAGMDILPTLHKWKNYKKLLEYFEIYLYPRPGYDKPDNILLPSVKIFDAPKMEISSTFIRQAILDKREVRYMLPEKVWEYLREMHFYEK